MSLQMGTSIPSPTKSKVLNYSKRQTDLLQSNSDEFERLGVTDTLRSAGFMPAYMLPSFLIRKSNKRISLDDRLFDGEQFCLYLANLVLRKSFYMLSRNGYT